MPCRPGFGNCGIAGGLAGGRHLPAMRGQAALELIFRITEFNLTPHPNHFYTHAVLSPEGRLEIVTDAGQDAMDADGAEDRRCLKADGEVVWS